MSTKKDKFSLRDKNFMKIAIDLAEARKGLTGENPSVGCVIVKNNKINAVSTRAIVGEITTKLNPIASAIALILRLQINY